MGNLSEFDHAVQYQILFIENKRYEDLYFFETELIIMSTYFHGFDIKQWKNFCHTNFEEIRKKRNIWAIYRYYVQFKLSILTPFDPMTFSVSGFFLSLHASVSHNRLNQNLFPIIGWSFYK